LLQSPKKLSAHQPRTGEAIWSFDATTGGISSPTAAGDMVYIPGDADLTALHVSPGSANWENKWQESQLATGSPSPVVDGNRIYVINRAGALTCGDAATGKVLWRQRLKGRYWATPLVLGNLLYCLNSDGAAQVVKAGDADAEIVSE